MRVVVPFVALHPWAAGALDAHVPEAERVRLSPRSEGAYYELLRSLWRAGDAFLVVEQDVEVHAEVVPSLERCSSPWCVFPYAGPGPAGAANAPLTRSLGCTRFSASLLGAEPSVMDELPVRSWRRLDCELAPALMRRGYAPHVHRPPVRHHHVYYGLCACGESHDGLAVDPDGRYVEA